MGAGPSKPDESTKHVFASDTPIQFSQEYVQGVPSCGLEPDVSWIGRGAVLTTTDRLIDSLQASSETNSTRAKTLELHIQQRVAEELEKIRKHESSAVEEARKRIIDDPGSDASPISPKDLIPGVQSDGDKQKPQTSQKVQQEIEKLRQQLGQRKTVKELPKEVENARQGVISCLRINDRKPLDCWKEVEIFKREVRKMEENYVSSIL